MGVHRKGYSLIEVLVALLVFTVGALALAAGSAVITRSTRVDASRERAVRAAESRLETIRARACGLSASDGRDEVSWSVTPTTDGTAAITRASAQYSGSDAIHGVTYESAVLCRQ